MLTSAAFSSLSPTSLCDVSTCLIIDLISRNRTWIPVPGLQFAFFVLGFPKRKSGRIENGRRIGESRKKRRTKVFEELTSSSEEDELEREWVSMNTKKSSNHI